MAQESKGADALGRPDGDRFEATVHPGVQDAALSRVADLDLDRIPDAHGEVRVVIESRDEHDTWGTVGVHENVIEASWNALVDSIEYKLCKDDGGK